MFVLLQKKCKCSTVTSSDVGYRNTAPLKVALSVEPVPLKIATEFASYFMNKKMLFC